MKKFFIKKKQGGINIIDSLILAFYFPSYLSTFGDLTIFQRLVLALPTIAIFLFLIKIKIIGRIIQILISLKYTTVFLNLLPFSKWVNGNTIWLNGIFIVIFCIFLILHYSIDETIETISELKRNTKKLISLIKRNTKKGKEAAKQQAAQKEHDEKIRQEKIANYERLQPSQNFTNALLTQCPIDSCYLIVSADNPKIMIKVVELRRGTDDPILGIHWFSDYYIAIFLDDHEIETIHGDETQEVFLKKIQYIESKYKLINCKRFSTINRAKKYLNDTKVNDSLKYNHSSEQTTQKHSERKRTNTDDSIDISLFNGCKDKDSITKRYHQLMKTFHPDTQNGDKEMTMKIQKTYEKLLKDISNAVS